MRATYTAAVLPEVLPEDEDDDSDDDDAAALSFPPLLLSFTAAVIAEFWWLACFGTWTTVTFTSWPFWKWCDRLSRTSYKEVEVAV